MPAQPDTPVAQSSESPPEAAVDRKGGLISGIKLATKIYVGVGVIFALLLLIGGVSLTGLTFIDGHFASFRKTSNDTTVSARLQTEILNARVAVEEFARTSSPAAVDRVQAHLSNAKAAAAKARAEATDADALAQVEGIEADLTEYQTVFDRVTELQSSRDALVSTVLDVKGPAAAENLATLMQGAYEDYDVTTAYTAGLAQSHLLTARVNARKFMTSADADARSMTIAELDLLAPIEEELASAVDSDERREMVTAAFAGALAYRTSFEEVATLIDDRNTLIATELASLGQRIADAAEMIRETAMTTQETVGPQAAAEIDLTIAVAAAMMAASLLVAGTVAVLLPRAITVPIRTLTDTMERLAKNDLDLTVVGTRRRDEIGAMARAVDVFKTNALKVLDLEAEQAAARSRTEREKRTAMETMADGFEESVGGIVASLSSLVADMRSAAEEMADLSGRAAQATATVAGVSDQSSANVQAVSVASEELVASISEISAQTSRAAEMARTAASETERGAERMDTLADAAQRVGDVITLIQDIAAQTNLLALNATIEAARAGEAGKGFAVVASEVKSLAGQTAKATDDIRLQIESIQTASTEAVDAIRAVERSVETLDEMNTGVASAIEEQSATTEEIARNTQEAAGGSAQVSSGITEVADATERTGAGARSVLEKCQALSEAAGSLDDQVRQFVERVRSA